MAFAGAARLWWINDPRLDGEPILWNVNFLERRNLGVWDTQNGRVSKEVLERYLIYWCPNTCVTFDETGRWPERGGPLRKYVGR